MIERVVGSNKVGGSNRSGVARELKNYTLNFGLQHLAAHGVLRLIIELKGEEVERADAHIGLLHRGTEKLMEGKTYKQGLLYMDRLDYVSMMAQEHTFALGVEKLLDLKVLRRGQEIRMIMLEITRILNHLLGVSCHALDVGAMTAYFWGFEEREKLMEYYERVSGARMHSAYVRVGGVSRDILIGMLEDIMKTMDGLEVRLNEIEELLTENRIWKDRLVGVGVISAEKALNLGFSGVMLRGSGIKYDLRVHELYERYSEENIRILVGREGDSYDRYIVRMEEMRESIRLIRERISKIKEGAVNVEIGRREMKGTMEGMIEHFKRSVRGEEVKKGEVYVGTEALKGEMGVYIESNGTGKLNRVKIRALGYYHLGGLEEMTRGHKISDVVTVIGTQDIVFGEVDR